MDNARRYEDLRQIELGRAVGDLFRWRLSAAPFGISVISTLVVLDHITWRRVVLVLSALIMTSVAAWQLVRDRRGQRGALDINVNLIAVSLVQLAVIAATGGLASPMFPAIFVMVVMMTTFLADRWLVLMALIQIAAVAVFTAGGMLGGLPGFPGLPEVARASNGALLVQGAFATFIVVGSVLAGRRARSAFEGIAQEAIRARDEALHSFADETRTVTTMAGEIAHELKNPLATVKGLAQLVAKDLEGKPKERMEVLRREVDRMASILEDFLNFSRPLTPLAQSETDLGELCRDVARLHEGAARERGVNIEIDAKGPIEARCDPRKIKQILVNLMQNAIAASPAGGTIRIAASTPDATAHVTVEDQGPGLSAAVATHAFEPGVTTKAGGSGLGLTISRALARQHGGDLALRSSPSGCVAELSIPREGAREEAS